MTNTWATLCRRRPGLDDERRAWVISDVNSHLPNLTFLHILSWFSDTQDDPCVADHDDDQGNQDGHTKNIKTLKYQLVQVLVKEVLGLPHYCLGRHIDNKASRELGHTQVQDRTLIVSLTNHLNMMVRSG